MLSRDKIFGISSLGHCWLNMRSLLIYGSFKNHVFHLLNLLITIQLLKKIQEQSLYQ